MASPPHIEAQIAGNVSGQVAVGSYIVQNNVDHGGVVFVAAPGETPVPRRRPLPVLLGGRVPAIIGRRAEISTIIEALGTSAPVELHGPAGIGKTALLKAVIGDRRAHAPDSSAVYHSAVGEPASDTLQFLFDAFYECSAPFKPTDAQIRVALADTRGLVVVDDASWSRDELSTVLDAVPLASALFASPRQSLWGTGLAMAVPGLDSDDAVALLAREIGRPLGPEETGAAQSTTAAIGREPLAVLQLASLVRTVGRQLAMVAADLQGDPSPAQEVARRLASSLTHDERRVLDALEAAGGATLTAAHLAALTGLADVQPCIDALVELRLAQAHSPRYSATRARPPGPEALRAAVAGLGASGDDIDQMAELAGAVVLAVRSAVARSDWQGVVSLGRLSETGLILGRRWGAWAEVLEAQRTAAHALGQGAAEAWALHQLGTRALCLDNRAEAEIVLTRALELRQALGDDEGAAATRHNLELLKGPPPAGEADGPAPPPPPPPPTRRVRGGAIVAGIVVLAVAALLLARAGIRSAGPPRPGRLVALDGDVDFGPVDVGAGGSLRSVPFVNDGARPLRTARLMVDGPQRDDFTIASSTCQEVTPPRSGCRVEVHFDPAAPGPRHAVLAVAGSVAGSPRILVQLSGQGTGVLAAPRARVDLTRLDFGEQPLLSPTAPQAVPVASVGAGPLLVVRAAVEGDDPQDFAVVDGCSAAAVPPGGACAVQVVFSAQAPGPRRASLALGFSGTGPVSVELSGTGVSDAGGDAAPAAARLPSPPAGVEPAPQEPEVATGSPGASLPVPPDTPVPPETSVTPETSVPPDAVPPDVGGTEPGGGGGLVEPPAALVVVPASLDFGTAPIGTAPVRADVTVVNRGRAPLAVQGVTLEGPGDFAVEGLACISDGGAFLIRGTALGTPVELAPGGLCVVTVSFAPVDAGSRFATLVVTAGSGREVVTLHGIGEPAPVTGGVNGGSGTVGASGTAGAVTSGVTGIGGAAVGT